MGVEIRLIYNKTGAVKVVQAQPDVSFTSFTELVAKLFRLKCETIKLYDLANQSVTREDFRISGSNDAFFVDDDHGATDWPSLDTAVDLDFDITPHMNLLVHGGDDYDFLAAVYELVDNSIQATLGGAERLVDVHIAELDWSLFWTGEKSRLVSSRPVFHVIDNGRGMTLKDLVRWATLGISDAGTKAAGSATGDCDRYYLSSDFARYGVGSKRAMFNLGDEVILSSKPRGSKLVNEVFLCKEKLQSEAASSGKNAWRAKFRLRPVDSRDPLHDSFTCIRIGELNPSHLANYNPAELRRILGHTYHYYVYGKCGNRQQAQPLEEDRTAEDCDALVSGKRICEADAETQRKKARLFSESTGNDLLENEQGREACSVPTQHRITVGGAGNDPATPCPGYGAALGDQTNSAALYKTRRRSSAVPNFSNYSSSNSCDKENADSTLSKAHNPPQIFGSLGRQSIPSTETKAAMRSADQTPLADQSLRGSTLVKIRIDGLCIGEDDETENDLETQYIHRAVDELSFDLHLNAPAGGKTVSGPSSAVVRIRFLYFPFQDGKETLPVPRRYGEAKLPADRADAMPLYDRDCHMECFWLGRLLPREHIRRLPFMAKTQNVKDSLTDQCFLRVKGTLFLGPEFGVTQNKMQLNQENPFRRMLLGHSSKTFQTKFINWLVQCHESYDEEILFGKKLETKGNMHYFEKVRIGSSKKFELFQNVGLKTRPRIIGSLLELYRDGSSTSGQGFCKVREWVPEEGHEGPEREFRVSKLHMVFSDKAWKTETAKLLREKTFRLEIVDTPGSGLRDARPPLAPVPAGFALQNITVALMNANGKSIHRSAVGSILKVWHRPIKIDEGSASKPEDNCSAVQLEPQTPACSPEPGDTSVEVKLEPGAQPEAFKWDFLAEAYCKEPAEGGRYVFSVFKALGPLKTAGLYRFQFQTDMKNVKAKEFVIECRPGPPAQLECVEAASPPGLRGHMGCLLPSLSLRLLDTHGNPVSFPADAPVSKFILFWSDTARKNSPIPCESHTAFLETDSLTVRLMDIPIPGRPLLEGQRSMKLDLVVNPSCPSLPKKHISVPVIVQPGAVGRLVLQDVFSKPVTLTVGDFFPSFTVQCLDKWGNATCPSSPGTSRRTKPEISSNDPAEPLIDVEGEHIEPCPPLRVNSQGLAIADRCIRTTVSISSPLTSIVITSVLLKAQGPIPAELTLPFTLVPSSKPSTLRIVSPHLQRPIICSISTGVADKKSSSFSDASEFALAAGSSLEQSTVEVISTCGAICLGYSGQLSTSWSSCEDIQVVDGRGMMPELVLTQTLKKTTYWMETKEHASPRLYGRFCISTVAGPPAGFAALSFSNEVIRCAEPFDIYFNAKDQYGNLVERPWDSLGLQLTLFLPPGVESVNEEAWLVKNSSGSRKGRYVLSRVTLVGAQGTHSLTLKEKDGVVQPTSTSATLVAGQPCQLSLVTHSIMVANRQLLPDLTVQLIDEHGNRCSSKSRISCQVPDQMEVKPIARNPKRVRCEGDRSTRKESRSSKVLSLPMTDGIAVFDDLQILAPPGEYELKFESDMPFVQAASLTLIVSPGDHPVSVLVEPANFAEGRRAGTSLPNLQIRLQAESGRLLPIHYVSLSLSGPKDFSFNCSLNDCIGEASQAPCEIDNLPTMPASGAYDLVVTCRAAPPCSQALHEAEYELSKTFSFSVWAGPPHILETQPKVDELPAVSISHGDASRRLLIDLLGVRVLDKCGNVVSENLTEAVALSILSEESTSSAARNLPVLRGQISQSFRGGCAVFSKISVAQGQGAAGRYWLSVSCPGLVGLRIPFLVTDGSRLQETVKPLQERKAELTTRIEAMKVELGEANQALENKKKHLLHLDQELSDLSRSLIDDGVLSSLQETSSADQVVAAIAKVEGDLEELRKQSSRPPILDGHCDDTHQEMLKQNGVIGVVAALGMAPTEAINTVLSLLAGQDISAIVVQDAASMSALLSRAEDKACQPLRIMPLDSLESFRGKTDSVGRLVLRSADNNADGFEGYAVNMVRLRETHEQLRASVFWSLFRNAMVFDTFENALSFRRSRPSKKDCPALVALDGFGHVTSEGVVVTRPKACGRFGDLSAEETDKYRHLLHIRRRLMQCGELMEERHKWVKEEVTPAELRHHRVAAFSTPEIERFRKELGQITRQIEQAITSSKPRV